MQLGASRPVIRREGDRRITAGGLLLSASFIVLAAASLLLPDGVRRGLWLPLHLALPGAATVAIGSVLPFFLAALATTRPGPPTARVGVIVLLGTGALSVAVGVPAGLPALATIGGLAFIAGLAGLGAVLVLILGGALGSQRGLLPRTYALGIANVIAGASLATAYVAGWAPVAATWVDLKPAHAWLNLFGFVGLVIAATLVHLYPTVVGGRIDIRPAVRVAMSGLALGPTTVALGYVLSADVVGRLGALGVLAGVLGLGRLIAVARAGRPGWTTERDWHRFATWSLGLGVLWYGLGIAVAAGRVLAMGVDPAAWRIELVGVPLAAGYVVQVLIGSWTHLLPAIGPGDMRTHARQRAVLGAWALPRLIVFNAGVALASLALPLGIVPVLVGGTLAATGALLAGVGLFLRAMFAEGEDPAGPPGKARQAGR